MATDLITSTQFANAVGNDPTSLDPVDLAKIRWAIAAASDAIRSYTDRDFTLTTDAIQGTRTYRYYGHDVLEIDDAESVTQVQTGPGPWTPYTRILDPTEWIAGPYGSLIQNYIELWTVLPYAASPEMGFKNNADYYGFRPHPMTLVVTAVWGWPAIPPAVQQAAVLVTADIMASPYPYTAEAIEGYSHSFGSGRSAAMIPQTVITVRAQSLLDPYTRVNV